DVLVCTTIVESGLDIPNANTLVVERADALGLSQLHQLRGRVGRGRERAYAYFLYPPEKPLSELAYDRLQTIAQNAELGAGMAAAHDPDALAAVREELADRYGPLPARVENLMAVAAFRNRARQHGITEVSVQGNAVRFAPLELRESQQLRLQRLYKGALVKQA